MTIFRKISWYIKGLKEYTKSGYEAASKSFNSEDLKVDLSDKTYMITGANSGVGKCCAEELAKLGGTIHMVCRNKERGEAAIEELKKSTGKDKFVLHILDMSKPGDVFKFAKNIKDSDVKLDVLINNAGCMINELKKNDEDVEMNFATNVLSVYILTEGLIETLKKSSDPRVITVSSGGMLVTKLDVSDVNWEHRPKKQFDGTMVYAQNKRQQVVITEQWAKKHEHINFYTMHPGWANTPAVASSMPEFYDKNKDKLRTPLQGADTMIWLAATKTDLKNKNGEFFQDRHVEPKHLTLAWTRSSQADETKLMVMLDKYLQDYSKP